MIVAYTVKAGPILVLPQRVVRDITILTLPNIKSHDHIYCQILKNLCSSSYPTSVYCLVIFINSLHHYYNYLWFIRKISGKNVRIVKTMHFCQFTLKINT